MNITEKLAKVQANLKAPKNNWNAFGKYNYRSCEDVLEAVKPLLNEFGLTLVMSDNIVPVNDRIYVKATATLMDVESDATIVNSAYARESFSKKGMEESQITGSASSYARKYALNGLFCIDDNKDADTQDNRGEVYKPDVIAISKKIEQTMKDKKISISKQAFEEGILKTMKVKSFADLDKAGVEDLYRRLESVKCS